MSIRNSVIAILGLVVAGFFLRSCFMGTEGEIRKQLSELQELVSYAPDEGDLASLTKVKRLGELFTDDVAISLTGFKGMGSVEGRKQVQQAAMTARAQAAGLEASLHDITVQVAEDEMSAMVEATGRAKVSGESSSIVQDFRFIFEKTPDGWLVAEAKTVQALR